MWFHSGGTLPRGGGVVDFEEILIVKPNGERAIVTSRDALARQRSGTLVTHNNRSRGGILTVGKRLAALLAVLLLSGAATACSNGGASPSPTGTTTAPSASASSASTVPSASTSAAADISGSITVLTNRTDIVDTVFNAQYVPAFNKIYPNVKVSFQALKDYEGETKIRMNTTDYGDVLLIPNAIKPNQLASYFTPLGTVADLSKTYRLTTEQSFMGTTYGLPVVVNANGIVYNKKVWDAAGITALPKTPDEFLADLQTIKDKNASTAGFIAPYYTNYHDGWPLTQWQSNTGEITANKNFNISMYSNDAPWTAGQDNYVIYKLVYDIINKKLVERDPTTTDWETSKGLLGTGKISAMALGSWAIVQMQQAAVTAGGSASDIHYMPFPSQTGGKFYSNIAGDYKLAINKNSKNQDAAKAWVYWFEDQSGFAFDQGGVSPRVDGKNPTQLADFDTLGVVYQEQTPATPGNEAWLGMIQDSSKIQLFDQTWVQRIVDAARGQTKESLDAIFSDLNAKWKAARAAVKAPSA
jgi:raffinose/stachyose/melibiose transport system substrate-binding protein